MGTNNNDRYKLGRIIYPIANDAHIKCADIYVTKNYLIHIEKKHQKELQSLNICALDYLTLIIEKYDEIRERRDNGIMLVKTNKLRPHDTCILELTYDNGKNCWEVKTAQPRQDVSDSKLLWSRKKAI